MTNIPQQTAVFFDLDGTLFDTAPDLSAALNTVLKRHGRPELDYNHFRPRAGLGSASMLKLAFGIEPDDPTYDSLRNEFLHEYASNLIQHTKFFPGMAKALDQLDYHQIPWGIVTSKLARHAEPIITHFKLQHRTGCLVPGDSGRPPKPNPDPLLYACQLANVKPEHSWYIGDSATDIQAAHAAGMRAIAVDHGYHDTKHPPSAWRAHAVISSGSEILPLILAK